ncbi:hypothetical protein Ndes2526B_g03587 [Nannochloris sp. 'desiccata']
MVSATMAPADIPHGAYVRMNINIPIFINGINHSFAVKDVILLLCGLSSTAMAAVTTGARRSSRRRKENTRYANYVMEVDMELGTPPEDDGHGQHTRPSHEQSSQTGSKILLPLAPVYRIRRQAEKDATEAEYDAYTAAAGFVRNHGDPATAAEAELGRGGEEYVRVPPRIMCP